MWNIGQQNTVRHYTPTPQLCTLTRTHFTKGVKIRIMKLMQGVATKVAVLVTWLIHARDKMHSCARLDVLGQYFVFTFLLVWNDTFNCGARLMHICDMTHSSVQHDSFISATWLIRKCDMTHSQVWHDSSISATWLVCKSGMIFPQVWRDVCVPHDLSICHASFICVAWRIHVYDMTYSCVTWRIHVYMMYTCMTRDLFSDVTSPTAVNDLHVWVTWLTLMYNMPHYCMHTCEHAHTHKHTHTQSHTRTHAHSHTHTGTHTHTTIREIRLYCLNWNHYGVATISRLLKIIGLFCRISSL